MFRISTSSVNISLLKDTVYPICANLRRATLKKLQFKGEPALLKEYNEQSDLSLFHSLFPRPFLFGPAGVFFCRCTGAGAGGIIRKVIKKVGRTMLEDEEFGQDFIQPVKSAGVREITGSVARSPLLRTT